MQGAQKLGYKHFVQTKKPPCVPIAQRPERWLIEESLGSPVEIVAGHCAAHCLGVGIKQHLQISGCVGLELVAGQADDVAVGQGLLGNGSLGHNTLLLAHEFVENYQTLDGKIEKLKDKNPDGSPVYYESMANIFANRDKRLAATVLYSGSEFKGKVTSIQAGQKVWNHAVF